MSTITNPDPSPGAPAFIPLEANPELMTSLLRKLGLSSALQVHDVYSITEPELLAFIPRPALALLLVFPRERDVRVVAARRGRRRGRVQGPRRQRARDMVEADDPERVRAHGATSRRIKRPGEGLHRDTPLSTLLAQSIPLPPAERSALLEKTPALASAHHEAASQGQTVAPDAQDDVDLHYVCFVKNDDGTLWELDGRRKGPIARGKLDADEDVLSDKALLWGPLKFLERGGGDMRFSCVALAGSLD
ncbi:hypothetical protein EKO27_g2489 [Xylaria grammica]|uniref:Ubiquitin carboxyl-terminal hydrolase n=1 Tax=Xylaria grammica TaxID=363999 RepID=A0A439DE33_9PEZI|nr:hypothetical protein EKO27_g2489 [Xylaria grammica]